MEIPMKQLVDYLNQRTKEYDEGHPTVSDEEWDRDYFKLQRMEQEMGYALPESPTQKITYDVVNELQKVQHNHAMLSADKTKDWDAFVNYFVEKDVVGMLKMDGLTLSIRYVDGKLVSAETRGNGSEGEDVLHNAKVIPSIPKIIDYKEELIIDGEIICTYKDFEKFADEYANPRNFASGSIRLLDARECARRNLTFVAWNVVKGLEDNLISNFTKLNKLGFTVVPYTSSFDWDAKDFLVDTAKELGYPIDGLVGRFTSREYGESLGATSHHSKAIYAFKFYDEEYETSLIDIEWGMGRTGILTPVAIFEDVDTGDSIVNRASLHNVSIAKELFNKPYVGQKMRIAKMNEIIPQVMWAETEDSDDTKEYLDIPKVCPVCGQPTKINNNDGVKTLYCTNDTCEGKILTKLEHYCSKKGMEIKNLSKMTLEKLLDWGWINSIKDLYELNQYKTEWCKKPGFGAASVNKILDAIEDSRNCNLVNFIASLGIPLVGTTIAKEIVKIYPTWEEFRAAVGGRWSDIDGFGPEMERALNKFDYAEADLIAEQYLVFQTIEPVQGAESATAAGLTFCVTGKLGKVWSKRDDLIASVESKGGKVSSSVTSKTNYLVNNDINSTSSKNVKAKQLNIPIITEEELIDILKN